MIERDPSAFGQRTTKAGDRFVLKCVVIAGAGHGSLKGVSIKSCDEGNAYAGAPAPPWVATRNNSSVVGVGNDYDNAVAGTPSFGQTLIHQDLSPAGDTYWVQILNSPTLFSGSSVSLSNSAPASDRFNLSLCEIPPALQANYRSGHSWVF